MKRIAAIAALFAAALLVAGCVTTVTKEMPSDYQSGFFVDTVEVVNAGDVQPDDVKEFQRKLQNEFELTPHQGIPLHMKVQLETFQLAPTGGGGVAAAILVGSNAIATGSAELWDPASNAHVASFNFQAAEYFGGLVGVARAQQFNNLDHLSGLFATMTSYLLYEQVSDKKPLTPGAAWRERDSLRRIDVEPSRRFNGRWKASTGYCQAGGSDPTRYVAELVVVDSSLTVRLELRIQDSEADSPNETEETYVLARATGLVAADGIFQARSSDARIEVRGQLDPETLEFPVAINGCKADAERQSPFLHLVRYPDSA